MTNEPLNAESAGINQTEAERLPYHAPKFVSLGPIQSLVRGQPLEPVSDGGVVLDGTAS
jgi:hypothetical protein